MKIPRRRSTATIPRSNSDIIPFFTVTLSITPPPLVVNKKGYRRYKDDIIFPMKQLDIRKIKDYFNKRKEVAAVYLYGSQARGDAKKSSDIDLAVLVTDRRKYRGFGIPQVVFAQDLSKITGCEVEVNDLETVSIDFAHRVLTEGKFIVSNNEKARIAFEEKVIRTYFDLKPALDEYFKKLSEITKKGQLHVRYI